MSIKSVPLNHILKLERSPVELELNKLYQEIGIFSHGKGIFHKEPRYGYEVGEKKLFLIKKGDFIFQITFAWEGAIALTGESEDGLFGSTRFPTFKVNEAICNPKFLLYYFKTKAGLQQIIKISPGSAGRNRVLSLKRISEVDIPIPPLEEQQQIVVTLERLIAKIEEMRRQSADVNECIESLFISQLKKIQNEYLEIYPNKKIEEIFEVTSGGTPSREISIYWNGDIPWVKTGELQDNDIFAAEEYITKEGLDYSAAKMFPKETILIALYGQGQTRGRTARLMIEATTNQACCAIMPNLEIMESKYLQYWLMGLYHEMRAKYRDGAQPNWNGKMIKAIKIALPPLPEQRLIIAHLDRLQAKVDEVKRLQAETEREMVALVPAVLAKAFASEH